jgi:hypothetical protein
MNLIINYFPNFLGGVTPLIDPVWNILVNLFAGFKILKEQVKFSSTDIIDPALSNSPQ